MSINNEPWRYSARQNKWFNNKHGAEGKAPGEHHTIQVSRPVSETSNKKPHEATNNPEAKKKAADQKEAVVPGFPQKFKNFFMNKIPSREKWGNFRDELIDYLKNNWGIV